MRVGDLVKLRPVTPHTYGGPGVVIEKLIRDYGNVPSRIYKVLWPDSVIATAWDHDLEVISESR